MYVGICSYLLTVCTYFLSGNPVKKSHPLNTSGNPMVKSSRLLSSSCCILQCMEVKIDANMSGQEVDNLDIRSSLKLNIRNTIFTQKKHIAT